MSSLNTTPRALVLSAGEVSPNDRNVGKLLDFFGIAWEKVTDRAIQGGEFPSSTGGKYNLLAAASALANLISGGPSEFGRWLEGNANSVFVYGFEESAACLQLLRFLTGDGQASIGHAGTGHASMAVTRDLPELCGPMSGMQVQVDSTETDLVFDLDNASAKLQRIVSSDRGDGLIQITRGGVSYFLNACADVIDIHTPSRKPFDLKQCFSAAVPITMYLKWAFGDDCWKGTETRACLIVDDPLLRPRYGFLRFKRALELMDEHNFTMSVAFIPWNQGRTDTKTVELFQQRSDRLSIAIHGCDHTASEYGSRSSAELNARTKVASRRMESLHRRTSLAHERIMVFPQGEFSTEAGRVLKLNNFVAAVNTEVTPSKEPEAEVTIADLWDVAINKYGSFPMFTRRYLTHGIENFAFDVLLGKPCLLVAHHDEFRDDGQELIGFIDRLNSLPWKLVWGNLGDVVSRSCKMRRDANGNQALQIYANRAFVSNLFPKQPTVQFTKAESDADCVEAVLVNQAKVEWNYAAEHLQFNATIPPNTDTEVRITYRDMLGNGAYPGSMKYRVKTGIRRYLSEARDQYLSQNEVLSKGAGWMRQILKGSRRPA